MRGGLRGGPTSLRRDRRGEVVCGRQRGEVGRGGEEGWLQQGGTRRGDSGEAGSAHRGGRAGGRRGVRAGWDSGAQGAERCRARRWGARRGAERRRRGALRGLRRGGTRRGEAGSARRRRGAGLGGVGGRRGGLWRSDEGRTGARPLRRRGARRRCGVQRRDRGAGKAAGPGRRRRRRRRRRGRPHAPRRDGRGGVGGGRRRTRPCGVCAFDPRSAAAASWRQRCNFMRTRRRGATLSLRVGGLWGQHAAAVRTC